MKISFWYECTTLPYSGANNFLRRLAAAIIRQGHEVVFNFCSDADVVLINAFVKGTNEYLKISELAEVVALNKQTQFGRLRITAPFFRMLPKKCPPIIHRVDGVTKLYGRITNKADNLTLKINGLCDFTVFQSKFCEDSFIAHGMRPVNRTIIHNGVPLSVFYPNMNRSLPNDKLKLIANSWSDNPMKGFDQLAEFSTCKDVEVSFIGRWPVTIGKKNVRLLGTKSETEIAQVLREHDVFLHAAKNEPCSNAIIEAIASGLPVLFLDSGGNKEIVRDAGMVIDSNTQSSIEMIRSNYKSLRQNALNIREQYSIDYVASEYIKLFDRLSITSKD